MAVSSLLQSWDKWSPGHGEKLGPISSGPLEIPTGTVGSWIWEFSASLDVVRKLLYCACLPREGVSAIPPAPLLFKDAFLPSGRKLIKHKGPYHCSTLTTLICILQEPEKHPSYPNSCTSDPFSKASLFFSQIIPGTHRCPLLKAQQPCLTRSLASPSATAELSSNQSIIYLPLGFPHFANLFFELVTDKLRLPPSFPFHLHPSFPSRAASLFLHH